MAIEIAALFLRALIILDFNDALNTIKITDYKLMVIENRGWDTNSHQK